MTLFALLVGAIISGGLVFPALVYALLAGFLITGAGNVINDYFDYETDKINAPHRPIPSGKISLNSAFSYFVALNIVGLAFALLVNTNFLYIAFANFVVSSVYSWKLKKTALVGNIAVSYLGAVPFFVAGLLTMGFAETLNHPVFILALIGFFGTLAREVLKDIRDVKGDNAINAKTLPIVASEKAARAVGNISLLVGIALLFAPYLLGMFGMYYLASVAPALLVCLYSYTKKPEKAEKLVKVAIFLILLAFLVGGLV